MSVEVVRTIAGIRARVAEARARGLSVGLVPTMGALHEGHAALIRRARAETGFVVVSVFVNPTQFDRKDDYELYPRNLDADAALCGTLGVDGIFAPDAGEMYPQTGCTTVEVAKLSEGLCGAFRPGHFRGVATVVAKLFHIVQADRAYFGEKDAQQLAIITRMVEDLNIPIEIVPVVTVREPDGLALSSRNQRLSTEARRVAPLLYRALQAAEAEIHAGSVDPRKALDAARAVLDAEPAFQIEYLEAVDPATMQPVTRIGGPVRVVAAVWLGGVRLIDNLLCVHRA
jgi:pantoate--beta-alanine ligase